MMSVSWPKAFMPPKWSEKQSQIIKRLSLFLPPALYVAVLYLPWPDKILAYSYSALWVFLFPASLLLAAGYFRNDWFGKIAGLTVTLILFSLPLLALWRQAGSHDNAIGGLLPATDARGYYHDAWRLLHGEFLNWSGRRPLFTGLLATVLWLTQENLQAALAICSALVAVACFVLAREVGATQGISAAVAVVLVIYLFSRYDGGSGVTLSENLGLPLGLLSFAVLWRGAILQRPKAIWLGLWLLTLAQCARPGCLLVLPALIAAGVWSFRHTRLLFLSGSLIAVGSGFLLNSLLVKVIAAPDAEAFSNFSQTLYGLVVGGKGWQQIYIDHPGAREGREMYYLAYQAFLAHPSAMFIGSLRMLREYFPPNDYHAFSFVRSYSGSFIAQSICYLLTGGGLFVCLQRLSTPIYLLLAAAASGHLLSIPFAPPVDSGMRTYAATMPVLALLIAIAVAEFGVYAKSLSKKVDKEQLAKRAATRAITQANSSFWGPAESCGVILAVVVIVGPLFLSITRHKPMLAEIPCEEGKETIYTRLSAGSSIRLPEAVSKILPLKQPELQNEAGRLTASSAIINAYELRTGDMVWLIAPPNLSITQPGLARFCGSYSINQQGGKSNVFFADSLQMLAPEPK